MKRQLFALFVVFNLCYADDDAVKSAKKAPDVKFSVSNMPPGPATSSPNITTYAPATSLDPIPTPSTETSTSVPSITTSTPFTPTSITSTSISPTSPSTSATKEPSPKTLPTVGPIHPTTTSAPRSDRKFDAPSFVGGMILISGLMAISFAGFKIYGRFLTRDLDNYHTL